MFFAKDTKTDEIVWAWHVTPSMEDTTEFVDPYTYEPVFLRTMHYRSNGRVFVRSHFVHHSSSYTKGFLDAYDNYPHWLAVSEIYRRLLVTYGPKNVSVGWSQNIPSPFSEDETLRIPDVVVKQGDKVIAIEVQRSPLTISKFRQRNFDYSFHGIYVIWLFDAHGRRMRKVWRRVFEVWDKIYFYFIPKDLEGDLDASNIQFFAYKDKQRYPAWLPDNNKYVFKTYATKREDFTWLRAHIPVSYKRPLVFEAPVGRGNALAP